jgi:hypothetical protein
LLEDKDGDDGEVRRKSVGKPVGGNPKLGASASSSGATCGVAKAAMSAVHKQKNAAEQLVLGTSQTLGSLADNGLVSVLSAKSVKQQGEKLSAALAPKKMQVLLDSGGDLAT